MVYHIYPWNELQLVIRPHSVDQAELEWMSTSPFIEAFESASVGPGDVVLDLGAHIGSFALIAAKLKQCRVVGFEPDLESWRLCQANILLNASEATVTCHRVAVGATSGISVLYEATENWAHTIVQDGGPYNVLTGRSAEVNSLSLSDALTRGDAHAALSSSSI